MNDQLNMAITVDHNHFRHQQLLIIVPIWRERMLIIYSSQSKTSMAGAAVLCCAAQN
jgi:hypothetical protein